MSATAPPRILVVKLATIGDLLSATPALRVLRGRHPDARIDALVTPGSVAVIAGLGLVDEMIVFDKHRYDDPRRALRPGALFEALKLGWRLHAGRYDKVLLFHHIFTRWGSLKYAALVLATGSRRRVGLDAARGGAWFLNEHALDEGFGALHEVDYALRVAAFADGVAEPIPNSSTRPEIAISAEDRRVAAEMLGGEYHPTVVIHPGSGDFSLARRWPVERFAAVGDRLVSCLGARVVIAGGPAEIELAESLAAAMTSPTRVLAGRTSLGQLAAVLEASDLYIGNDSGVTHIASAVDVPMVVVYGPTSEKAWGPYGYARWWGRPTAETDSARFLVVRADPPCSPCLYVGFSMGSREGCPDRKCLMNVSVSSIVGAAEYLLGRRIDR